MTIREARKQRGITQEVLAKKLKVTQSAVARWENGEHPPLKKYHKTLARVLGVPASELDELNRTAKVITEAVR